MELNLSPDTKEQGIVYRTGKVADPVTPKPLIINGRIDAPRLYLSKKLQQNGDNPFVTDVAEVDIEKFQEPTLSETVIVINEDKNTITLRLNPNHPTGTVITGKLELNPDLVAFGIAVKAGPDYHTYSRETLHDLVRWNKRFFKDEIKANELMAALKKMDVKAMIDLSVSSDNRGNKGASFDKKVEAKAIPDYIVLKMPIYDGEGEYEFPIDICLDTTEGRVKFWLESPVLGELIETTKLAIFDREVKEFEEFVVVWE